MKSRRRLSATTPVAYVRVARECDCAKYSPDAQRLEVLAFGRQTGMRVTHDTGYTPGLAGVFVPGIEGEIEILTSEPVRMRSAVASASDAEVGPTP